jgi:hypothetical protein
MNDSAIYNADYKQTVEFYGAGGIFLRDAAEEVAACCGDEPFLPTPVPRTASGVNLQDGSSITSWFRTAVGWRHLWVAQHVSSLNRAIVMCIAVRMLVDTPVAADYIDEDTGNVRLPVGGTMDFRTNTFCRNTVLLATLKEMFGEELTSVSSKWRMHMLEQWLDDAREPRKNRSNLF